MDSFKDRIHKAFGTHRGAKSAAARALGVAQPQLSMAMTDKRPPSAEMLDRLTRFEQGLPPVVARIKHTPVKRTRTTMPAPLDDSTPAERVATVRAHMFELMSDLIANGYTGRDMAAACPELYKAWRTR